MAKISRKMEPRLARALSAYRVVVIGGPRQVGKTTLARELTGGRGTFRQLDVDTTLATALVDPVGFARHGATPRAIDEVQLGGDALVRAIKVQVDADDDPGQFLLTGSADFLTVPTLSESLAGRAVFFELWPFSQGELRGEPDGFLDTVFREPDSFREGPSSALQPEDYLEAVCQGGFPEALRLHPDDRGLWYDALVQTVTQRDIVGLTGARRAGELPRLLRLLAARTANELVASQIGADSQLSRDTLADYIGFLRMIYFTRELPAWSSSHTNRAKQRPKIYLTDTGLASHLLDADPVGLLDDDGARRGQLVETFVVNELRKQLGWSRARAELFHFRDRDGGEIDIVVERPDGRVVGIEVKSGLTVTGRSFTHLTRLRDRLGDAFVHGYVLSFSPDPLPFGDRLTALPISYLWQAG
ncbi:hypothetical protein Ppa06_11600 [Planomonospora parontospora subsp. parontospora]|uniref:ATP-binding protein n=2 Tax=Planomonospora parontospora TaxID=58119 RepID=A0AA37BDG7_9ACTN|nr:ATP-binding protein [Planomonospora parontospora]GGK55606.1 hypothetical protein GCM10010126_13980 [Planomonospora parontospora]GII07362.1 hypothetical protein Ppa06_11600 [Planomonospora parontospora subsp. parontospora]